MPFYRDRDACGQPDEITVIEDKNMMVAGADGSRRPGFEYINHNTIRAHPLIIDVLLRNIEPVWSLDEILFELEH